MTSRPGFTWVVALFSPKRRTIQDLRGIIFGCGIKPSAYQRVFSIEFRATSCKLPRHSGLNWPSAILSERVSERPLVQAQSRGQRKMTMVATPHQAKNARTGYYAEKIRSVLSGRETTELKPTVDNPRAAATSDRAR